MILANSVNETEFVMLYHYKVHMPKRVRGLFPKDGRKSLRLGFHVRERIAEKKLALPNSVNLAEFAIVELEVSGPNWTKAVIREAQSDLNGRSLVLVVMKTDVREEYFVKSAWYNDSNDNHITLDSTPYEKA